MMGVIVIIFVKIFAIVLKIVAMIAIVCVSIMIVAVVAIWIVVAIVNRMIIAGFGFVMSAVIVVKLNGNILVKKLCLMIFLI